MVTDGASGGLRGGEDDDLLLAGRTQPEAFGQFYDRRQAVVWRWFYRRTRSPDASAELTAETFAEALRSLHRFDPSKGSAMAWTMGIAANLHRRSVQLDRGRGHDRIEAVDVHRTLDDLEQIESRVDVTRAHDALADALEQLSPLLRQAVLLRVALDLPYPEVALRLGCSPGTARVRVCRGLRALSSQLDARRAGVSC